MRSALLKARFQRTGTRIRTLEVCLFLALASSCSAAHAQDLRDYHHTAWTTEKGLSAVWAVQQAPNGHRHLLG